jgi:hypothetical protein
MLAIRRRACALPRMWIGIAVVVIGGHSTALRAAEPAAGVAAAAAAAVDAEPAPLAPAEARKKVGEQVTVQYTVESAKDRLEKRGEIYLDADLDFRSDANFAVVVTRAGAASLQGQGIRDITEHFSKRLIRATGIVKLVDEVPRIEIDDADQIKIIDPK